jgi:putative ABC transport system substrate-binding protein
MKFNHRRASLALRSSRLQFDVQKILRLLLRRSRAERRHFDVCPGALVNANRSRINTLALGARLPTMHGLRDLVGAGGLLSYGANNTHLFGRSAEYVDKILKGAKPADLPVEQPTKFELVIDLTTAKALRLAIPEPFLLRADEVIE